MINPPAGDPPLGYIYTYSAGKGRFYYQSNFLRTETAKECVLIGLRWIQRQ